MNDIILYYVLCMFIYIHVIDIIAVAVISFGAQLLPGCEASPIRFMCDMCESNWLHCMMKCHMEMYMTRHDFDK